MDVVKFDLGHYRLYTKLQIIPVGANLAVEAGSIHSVNDTPFDKYFFENYSKEVKQKILELLNHG